MAMEKQYSVQFFTSLVESIQKCCRDFLEFDQAIELSGYLNLEIDNFKKERYVLSEMITNTGDVISESYCTKAFKTVQRNPRQSPTCTDNVLKDNTNHFDRSRSNMIGVRESPGPQDIPRTAVKRHFGMSQRHVSPFHPGRRRNLIQSRRSVPTSFTQSSPSQPKNNQHYEIQPRSSVETFPSNESIPSTSQSFSSFGNDTLMSSALKTSVEDASHRKEKSSDIEALYAAATSVPNLEQSEFTPVSCIYTSVSQTNVENTNSSQNTPLESEGSFTASETIHLPVTIKEEDNDDDDIMFIESPSDTTGNVSGQSGSVINTDSCVDISRGSLQGNLNTADGEDGSVGADMKMDLSAYTLHVGSNEDFLSGGNHSNLEATYSMNPSTQKSPLYPCKFCGLILKSYGGLRIHERLKHEKKPTYTCDYCSKSFMSNARYMSHVNHHAQIKPYNCVTCSKSFESPSTVKIHMKTCGRKESVKNVYCPVCFKCYESLKCMKEHRRRCHVEADGDTMHLWEKF